MFLKIDQLSQKRSSKVPLAMMVSGLKVEEPTIELESENKWEHVNYVKWVRKPFFMWLTTINL